MSRTDEDTMWQGSGINTGARFSPTDLRRGVRQGWSKQSPAWQLGRCEQQDQTDSPISSLSGVSFTLNGARVLKSCFHRYWGVNRTGQETLERLFVLCPEKRWMKKKKERGWRNFWLGGGESVVQYLSPREPRVPIAVLLIEGSEGNFKVI